MAQNIPAWQSTGNFPNYSWLPAIQTKRSNRQKMIRPDVSSWNEQFILTAVLIKLLCNYQTTTLQHNDV